MIPEKEATNERSYTPKIGDIINKNQFFQEPN